MKKLIGLTMLAGLLSAGVLQAQDKVIDQIVAVVGGNTILKSDIEGMYIQKQAQGITSDGDMKCEVLEELLIEKLLVAEALLDTTIEVSDSQINQSLDQRIQYFVNNLGSEKEVENYFKKSIIEIKADLEEVIRNQQLTGQMQNKIIKDVTVTPAEVRYYYRNIKQEDIPLIDAYVEYEQITFRPRVDPEEENRVKNRLRELKKRIEDGASFASMAVIYSECPSAPVGGELGYSGRASLDPAYAASAFNLKGDRVSNVVKSEFGYHIIQMIDRKGEQVNTRHILMKPKVSDEAMEQARQRLDSLANFIREQKITFEQAAASYSWDKNSRNNGGLVINPMTMSSKWKITELNPEVSKVLVNMNINEVSRPFQMIDESTKQNVYGIVKLVKKVDTHKANVSDDYIELSQIYLEKKKQEALDKWIRDKQAITYIHIDDTYANCQFRYSDWKK
ncbi:MAG: peptidylprolyl isomerase [Prolixibacteraceae bacterium]|jgi:peptidyl-prolyl cis-trans isomerase SurA|nr:peptidylprolyl isomerase [Prolixibacteraceae bacterium]